MEKQGEIVKDIAEITAELELHKADRTRLLKAYPDFMKWETDDEEIYAWVHYEYTTGLINAMESILGMKLTFGQEWETEDKAKAEAWQEEYVQAREKASSTRWDESEDD